MATAIVIFIMLSAWLASYMLQKDRGEREPVSVLWGAVAFGLLGLVPAVLLEAKFLPEGLFNLDGTGLRLHGAALAQMALVIGVVEELCKFLPLALFLHRKGYFNEHGDGVIYFALAGIGFGLPENILYTLALGTEAGIARLVLTPFFHAATAAIAGYYLARAIVDHKPLYPTAFIGIGIAIILHALYDYGLLSGKIGPALLSLAISIGLSITVFRLAAHAAKEDSSATATLSSRAVMGNPSANNPEAQSGEAIDGTTKDRV